ncbi:MAG: hypothetical protein Q8871_01095 [Pigeon pea little leaf phytoplasma]|nr:hypothetical protein [Pigeon pea little leaf phytoplasma]
MSFYEPKKIKKLDSKTLDIIIISIHKVISKICELHALLKTYHETSTKEMFLSSLIKLQLEQNLFGVLFTTETINGHGKVDIMIQFKNNLKHVIECKRYNGKKSIKTIYKQINRHTTLYDKTVSLIMFCENQKFTKTVLKIKNWINENGKLINKTIKNYKNYKNVWKSDFIHDYGHTVTLHCACYHLYFDDNHAKFKS